MFNKEKSKMLRVEKVVRITDGMDPNIFERMINHITKNAGFYLLLLAILYLGLDPVEAMALDLEVAIGGMTDSSVELAEGNSNYGFMMFGAIGLVLVGSNLTARIYSFGERKCCREVYGGRGS